MTLVLSISLGVIVYFCMGMFTWTIVCLAERLNGEDADMVYDDDEKLVQCLAVWFIILPVFIIYLLWRLFKKWSIALIEIIVASRRKNGKED